MRQSNVYVIIFSAILTIVLGGLLAATSVGLGPIQKKSVELDTKKQILGAVMVVDKDVDVLELYDRVIQSEVVNAKGEIVAKDEDDNTMIAENINVGKEFDKAPEDRLFPVFKFFGQDSSEDVKLYVLPVYGNGLWDNIWGYIAVDPSGEEIEGAVFAHAGETPGLGARITEEGVQDRFKGKRLYNNAGEYMAIKMLKGENNPENLLDDHHVDGLSGATITANGVSKMLDNYFQYYQPYFNKKDKATASL